MNALSVRLALVHVVAGAAWFGAMLYSLAVLQPRAAAYFADDLRFEAFITAVSHGARRKVLAAFGVVGGTGLALAAVRWTPATGAVWVGLIGAKVVLFLAALGLFVHVSWRLWPARLFAAPAEVPGFQRAFRRAGFAMIVIVGLSLALGVLSHRI